MEVDIIPESPCTPRISFAPLKFNETSCGAIENRCRHLVTYLMQWANCLEIAPAIQSIQDISGDFTLELLNIMCGGVHKTSRKTIDIINEFKSECIDSYFENHDLVNVTEIINGNTQEIVKFSSLMMYLSFIKTRDTRLIGPPQKLEYETQDILHSLVQGILSTDKYLTKSELDFALCNCLVPSCPGSSSRKLEFSKQEAAVYTSSPRSPLCDMLKDSKLQRCQNNLDKAFMLNALKNKVQEKSAENDYLQDEVKECQERLKCLEVKLEKEKQCNVQLRRQNEEFQAEIFQLHQNGSQPECIDKFRQQISSLQTRVSELEQENDVVSNAHLDLQREFEVIKCQHEQCRKYRQQVQTYEEVVDGYSRDLTRLRSENEALLETNKELFEHLEQLRAANKTRLDESEEAVTLGENLKESCIDRQFEEMKTEYNKLTLEWSNLADLLEGVEVPEVERQSEDTRSLREKIKHLIETNSGLQFSLESLVRVLEQKQGEIDVHVTRIETLDVQIKERAVLVTSLQENISCHESKNRLLNDELTSCQALTENLRNLCDSLQTELNILTEESTVAALNWKNVEGDYQVKIIELESEIKENIKLQSSLAEKVQQLEEVNQEQFQKCQLLESQLVSNEQKRSELEQKIAEEEEARQQLIFELGESRVSCSALQTNLNEKMALCSQFQVAESGYRETVSCLENRIKEHLDLQSGLLQRVQQLEEVGQMQLQKCHMLESDLATKEQRCCELECMVAEKDTNYLGLERTLAEKEHECVTLANQVAKESEECSLVKLELRKREERLIILEQQSNERESKCMSLECELKSKCAAFEQESAKIEGNCQQLEKELQLSREKYMGLEQTLEKKDSECVSLQNFLSENRNDCLQLKRELDEAITKCALIEQELSENRDECSALKKEFDLLTDKCASFEHEFNNSRDKCLKFELELSEKVSACASLQQELDNSNSKCLHLERQLCEKSDKCGYLEQDCTSSRELCSSLERQLNERLASYASLEHTLTEKSSELSLLKEELDRDVKKCIALEQELGESSNKCIALEQELGESSNKFNALKQEVKANLSERFNFEQEFSDKHKLLEQELNNNNEELSAMRLESSEREKKFLDAKNELENRCSSLEQELTEKCERYQILKQKYTEENDKLAVVERDLDETRKKFINLEHEGIENQKKCLILEADLREKQTAYDNLKFEITSLRTEQDNMSGLMSEKDEMISTLEADISQREINLNMLLSTIQEKEDLCQKKDQELSSQLKVIESVKSDFEHQADVCKQLESELQKKDLALKESELNLLTKVDLSGELELLVSSMKTDLENLNTELTQLQKDKKELEAFYDLTCKKTSELEILLTTRADVATKSINTSESTNLIASFGDGLDSMNALFNAVTSRVQEVTQGHSELERVLSEHAAKCISLEAEVGRLSAQCQLLQEERDHSRTDLDFKKKQYKELQTEYNEKCRELNSMSSQWDGQLQSVTDAKTNLVNSYEAKIKSLIDGFGVRVDDMNAEKQELEMRLENSDNERNNASRQLSQKELMYRALEDQLASIVQEKSNTEFQNEELSKKNQELTLLVSKAKEELVLLGKKMAENASLWELRVTELNDKIGSLRSELAQREEALVERESQAVESRDDLQKERDKINEVFAKIKSEINDIDWEISDASDSPVEAKVASLFKQYSHVNCLLREEKEKVVQLSAEVSTNEEKFSAVIKELQESICRCRQEKSDAIQELESMRSGQEKELQDKVEQRSLELLLAREALQSEINDLKCQNESLNECVSTLQTDLAEAEKKTKEKTYQKMKQTFQSEIDRLLLSMDELEKDHINRSMKYKNENKVLKEKYETAKQKLSELHEEMSAQSKASHEIKTMRQQYAVKRDKLMECKAALEKERKSNLDLRRKLNEKEKCTVPYSEKIRELEMALKKEVNEKRSLDAQVSLANQKIVDLKKQLEINEPGKIALEKTNFDPSKRRQSTMNSVGDQLFGSLVKTQGLKTRSRTSFSSIGKIQFDDDMFKIPGPLNDTSSSTELRRKTMLPPSNLSSIFVCEDEDSEIFSTSFLADLNHGKCETEDSKGRLSELQRRNTLCLPHLKSSYPAETQFHDPVQFTEDELKVPYSKVSSDETFHGMEVKSLSSQMRKLSVLSGDHSMLSPESPASNTRSRKRKSLISYEASFMDSSTDSSSSLRKKMNVHQTAYQKPGPPTPGKNQGSANRKSKLSARTPASIRKLLGRSNKLNDSENVNPKTSSNDSLHKIKQGLSFSIGFSPKQHKMKKREPVELVGIQKSSYALRSTENVHKPIPLPHSRQKLTRK